MIKTPILTPNEAYESELDSYRPSIQPGLEVVDVKKAYPALAEYDESHDRVVISFTEDQLVLLHGMIKHVIDLQTTCGSQPVNEMLEMESVLAQAADLFYEEEADDE
jgi:hypothetical protein